ncbi:MAG: succinate dehydrogenase, cytochrome b556 subunit [Novosphingobium lindaniclasticum]|nr:succinate dehydrogenase, cytochrome b556 subunit [Novosphingobium lindaniclasticum]MDF2639215.1 succinate dehydrogenase, cytochrome b556 subunit [Novosphingobium lindaniclasticum]
MLNDRRPPRPTAPHLMDGPRFHWRWGPHMLVSILHRVSGTVLSLAGLPILIVWLGALVAGPDTYASFAGATETLLGRFVLFVVSWAFFMHMLSGLRHFVLDAGAGYELQTNKRWALVILVAAPLMTVLFWILVLSR